MSDSKPAIPAWQRAAQDAEEQPPAQNKAESSQKDAAQTSEEPGSSPTNARRSSDISEESVEDQLAKVRAFLDHPEAKDAPVEKKRAFLESKDIAPELIDRVLSELSQTSPSFATNEFQTFAKTPKQQAESPTSSSHTDQPAPPIITYPEFLVNAHKPPPLVTAERVANAAYFFGGVTALMYGASKFLCAPMSAALNDARHEFALHTQSKIDEMNERLGKLTSRQPDSKRGDRMSKSIDTLDDELSVDSDPSELFHRDIGVQTSPPVSKAASVADASDSSEDYLDSAKSDPTESQIRDLKNIQSHLDDIISSNERLSTAQSDRRDAADKLQHYLDTLLYSQPGGTSLWNISPDDQNNQKSDDAVEKLKKEIRSVKGLMLSAKRFPAVGVR